MQFIDILRAIVHISFSCDALAGYSSCIDAG